MMEIGLNKNEINNICSVLINFNELDEVVVFGSRAKGNFKPGSDVDLALKGRGLNLNVLNRISNELDDLDLPYLFDLCIYDRIENPAFKEHINSTGISFYRNNRIVEQNNLQ